MYYMTGLLEYIYNTMMCPPKRVKIIVTMDTCTIAISTAHLILFKVNPSFISTCSLAVILVTCSLCPRILHVPCNRHHIE